MALGCQAPAAAPPGKPSPSILFLGNSYTGVNNLPEIVSGIAAGIGYAKPKIAVIAPGGWTLDQHATDPQVIRNLTPVSGTAAPWDVVVLQEQSTRPAFAEVVPQERKGFQEGMTALCGRMSALKPSPKIVLFETWARAAGTWKSRSDAVGLGADPSEMQDRIRKWYEAAASQYCPGAVIARVGDFWKAYQGSGSGLALHGPDGSHPSYAGSYFAGLVIASAIYGPAWKTTFDGKLGSTDAASIRTFVGNHTELLPVPAGIP